MMKFDSKKIQSKKSQQELFNHLSKLENYEELMPEKTDFDLHESGERFTFQLSGLPKVGLKLKEKVEPEYILFESPNDNFNYQMKVITEAVEDGSQASINFEGKFNPMIEMMAKKPLTNFLEKLTENMNNKI